MIWPPRIDELNLDESRIPSETGTSPVREQWLSRSKTKKSLRQEEEDESRTAQRTVSMDSSAWRDHLVYSSTVLYVFIEAVWRKPNQQVYNKSTSSNEMLSLPTAGVMNLVSTTIPAPWSPPTWIIFLMTKYTRNTLCVPLENWKEPGTYCLNCQSSTL